MNIQIPVTGLGGGEHQSQGQPIRIRWNSGSGGESPVSGMV